MMLTDHVARKIKILLDDNVEAAHKRGEASVDMMGLSPQERAQLKKRLAELEDLEGQIRMIQAMLPPRFETVFLADMCKKIGYVRGVGNRTAVRTVAIAAAATATAR